jgi:DNA-binding NarL/FixJ family response regulator
MSISISSLVPTTTGPAVNAAPLAPTPAPRDAPPAPELASDTVKLSQSQQVYQLYKQGQRVSQIATSLNLSVSVVNNYLGISGSTG